MNTAFGLRGNRQGSAPILHSFPIDYTATSATAIKLCVVKASAAKPVYVEVSAIVSVANNTGTTATLSVGVTGAGYTDMINAASIAATANTAYPASNAVVKRVYTADTTIYALPTWTGTAATAGRAYVMVKIASLNKNTIVVNA